MGNLQPVCCQGTTITFKQSVQKLLLQEYDIVVTEQKVTKDGEQQELDDWIMPNARKLMRYDRMKLLRLLKIPMPPKLRVREGRCREATQLQEINHRSSRSFQMFEEEQSRELQILRQKIYHIEKTKDKTEHVSEVERCEINPEIVYLELPEPQVRRSRQRGRPESIKQEQMKID